MEEKTLQTTEIQGLLQDDFMDSDYLKEYEIDNSEDIAYFAAMLLDVLEEDFNDGIDQLAKHDSSFRILYNLFLQLYQYTENRKGRETARAGFTIIQEENYVDRIYRDSYYFYYSGKNFPYNRYCKRIILFAKLYDIPVLDLPESVLSTDCAGSIVLRPIVNKIGRSFLNPRYFIKPGSYYIRLTNYDVTVFGKRLSIEAFPFSMQDGETTTCAEITILNLLDYYSKTYAEYHYLLPSEIHQISLSTGFQRSLPSQGLKYEMISKIFCEAGFWPRLYYTQKINREKMRRILYYYIESGIPLSVGLNIGVENKHSVIIIGHGEQNRNIEFMKNNLQSAYNAKLQKTLWLFDTADSVNIFCVMDDGDVPYKMQECYISENMSSQMDSSYNLKKHLMLGNNEIVQILVPLYKKMYLEASDASEIFKNILASEELGISINDFTGAHLSSDIGSMDCPLMIRIFMASTRGFTRQRSVDFSESKSDAASWYQAAVFPRFIWVCEISAIDKPDEVIGELVLDATASPSDNVDALIILHYPNRIYCKLPSDAVKYFIDDTSKQFHQLDHWKPFKRYTSNLSSFTT